MSVVSVSGDAEYSSRTRPGADLGRHVQQLSEEELDSIVNLDLLLREQLGQDF